MSQLKGMPGRRRYHLSDFDSEYEDRLPYHSYKGDIKIDGKTSEEFFTNERKKDIFEVPEKWVASQPDFIPSFPISKIAYVRDLHNKIDYTKKSFAFPKNEEAKVPKEIFNYLVKNPEGIVDPEQNRIGKKFQ